MTLKSLIAFLFLFPNGPLSIKRVFFRKHIIFLKHIVFFETRRDIEHIVYGFFLSKSMCPIFLCVQKKYYVFLNVFPN